ncbi:MAG: efflux RND transporter permease subunit, partial [Polyangiaceae bacterium]
PGLPIAQYPQIALPQVVVSTFYVGASATEVEASVTIPLEQQINGVQGMKYITSSSSNDGSSSISVVFDSTRDVDLAAVDVQNRVNTALARLPVEVRSVGVTVTKNSGAFVGAAALFTDDDRYEEKFLSNYADVFMKDRLKRVPGVADVIIFGERRFSMRIWLDPAKLAARSISPADVVVALREQNVQVAAGAVGLPPAPDKLQYQFSVRAVGRLTEASQFEDVVIKSLPDGTIVRLKDIGRAELGAESYSTLSRYKGRRAIGLGILQLPGSNALDVKKRAVTELERLAKQFPSGLKYEMAFDTTLAVSASIREVLITLAEAIFLVIGTIFLFLQSWRTTVIPAITIPVSLVGTFAFVKLFGFSINTLTLFGLTLATGLVVDDAIVVIENISRLMEEKKLSAREAAPAGMAEVTSAVIATSLVLVAVFVPVAFFPGTTGKIYQQFSLTIAFSIALSAFNAVTLTPALSARLLRPGVESSEKNVFFRGFDGVLAIVRRAFAKTLGLALRHRTPVLVAFVGILGLTAWVFKKVPTGFVPEEDQGYFIIVAQAPEGSSLGYTSDVLKEVEAIVAKVPEIRGCFVIPGFSPIGSGPNKGVGFCSLVPWEDRPGKGSSVAGVIDRLRGPLMGIGTAFVLPFAPPSLQGVGNFGGFQFELEDQSSDPKIENLAAATTALTQAGNANPALKGVFSSFTANDPQLVVEVDRDRAKALDVSLDEVFATLQIYLGSAYVNDFVFGTRTYRVYVQADQAFRSKPRDIETYYVRSRTGQMVSMGALVKVTTNPTAQTIGHYNLFRATEIQGSPAPGFSSGQALEAMQQVAEKSMPPGMSYEWSG